MRKNVEVNEVQRIVNAAVAQVRRRGRRAKLPDLSSVVGSLNTEDPRDIERYNLRLQAQMCDGLRRAWSRKPDWYLCSIAFSTGAQSSNSPAHRLQAFLDLNRAIVSCFGARLSEQLTLQAVSRALKGLSEPQYNRWRARAYIVFALRFPRHQKRTRSLFEAQRLLKSTQETELKILVQQLLGQGKGRVPGSGWLGTGFRARSARLGPHHLYYFNE